MRKTLQEVLDEQRNPKGMTQPVDTVLSYVLDGKNCVPMTVAMLTAGGGTGGGAAPAPLRVLGSQELTLTAAAQGLTVPAGASYAEIQVQGGDARVRYDGAAPTASSGFLWADGGVGTISTAAELGALRAVSASGSPKLFVTYRGA